MKSLANMQLIVNELCIKNNNMKNGSFQLVPKFIRKIGSIDDTHMFTELRVEIHNTEENPFPLDVDASMTGIFDISNIPKESIDGFMKVQSVHIMLPYLRSLISTATGAALMTPVLLPVYDAKELFPE